jgi:CRISPR-associated endonuclease/helicase Cas3
VTGDRLAALDPADLLDDYPLKPHELLRDRTDRVFRHLEEVAERSPELLAWVVEPDGRVRVLALSSLVEKDRQKKPVMRLDGRTVLLPPRAGGLAGGLLDGTAAFVEQRRAEYDVADQWFEDDERTRRRRERRWDDERPAGMRLVRAIECGASAEESGGEEPGARRVWRCYVRVRSAGEDAGSSGLARRSLQEHHADAAAVAVRFSQALGLPEPIRRAVVLAAKAHDLGKRRTIWQGGIGNAGYDPEKPETALAKSGHGRPPEELNHYRHEFGSLLDLLDEHQVYRKELAELPADQQELVLHLIAAHHGRARPHFPPDEAFDPERPGEDAERAAQEVPRRFARLHRTYGRWGLAYLESLLRAADILASQPPKEGQG